MGLEGLVENRCVAFQNLCPSALLIVDSDSRYAQKTHDVFDPHAIVWFAEGEELPETFYWIVSLFIGGRIENVVKPTLRLGEPLRLAQMHGNGQRDVEK